MEKIEKRLNALRNIQLEIDQAESKLSEEIIQLECKHAPIFDALYKKRESIVNGEREPTEDEAKWEYEKADLSGLEEAKIDTSKPGIPGFWLRVLESGNLTNGIILEDDKPILQHLRNIKIKQNSTKPYGFTLEFYFDDNEYFKNKVLTKSYEFTLDKDKRNPLNSTNNSLYRCTGCMIEWNEGKSPVKESDENESGSFFDFFRTHTPDGIRPAFSKAAAGDNKKTAKNGNGKKATDGEDDEDEEELEHLFELDYEIGKFIKDMIIPKALLFFTGEINELEEDMEGDSDDDLDDGDDDDNESDDDDDDDDDDDEDERDTKPKKKVKTTK